jgi:antitoxin component YwqK of YwqJK toxin-antitoxin module
MCCYTNQIFSQKKKKLVAEKPITIVKYELSLDGDTINKIDSKSRKQSTWVIKHEELRGEPSFTEIGKYADNIKIGKWKYYNKEGIVMKEENFKLGALDGEIKFYEDGYLTCIGSFLALNTKNKFDTFYVEMPNTDVPLKKIVPSSTGSVKHGFWTYYEAPLSRIVRVQEYQADEMIYEKEYTSKADSTYIKSREKLYIPEKGVIPQRSKSYFWGKDKNKKVIRYTDFPDNPGVIKPNVRRK